jgi:nitrite reductase/ring-hydroxylating ferredoxin subunit
MDLKDDERLLCRLDEIEDGATRGFPAIDGLDAPAGLFVLRQGDTVIAYINSCPHLGTPLNWQPDIFLTQDNSHIQCSTHGALFEIADGECISGPCYGESLDPVAVRVTGGAVVITLP